MPPKEESKTEISRGTLVLGAVVVGGLGWLLWKRIEAVKDEIRTERAERASAIDKAVPPAVVWTGAMRSNVVSQSATFALTRTRAGQVTATLLRPVQVTWQGPELARVDALDVQEALPEPYRPGIMGSGGKLYFDVHVLAGERKTRGTMSVDWVGFIRFYGPVGAEGATTEWPPGTSVVLPGSWSWNTTEVVPT
jgi:hypothetical protein